MRFGLRWQIALVGVLFAASLLILLSSSLAAFGLPRRQLEAQRKLTEASHRMAQEAEPLMKEPPFAFGSTLALHLPPSVTERLTAIAHRVLSDFPDVEGGFYLIGFEEKFAGHAFPIDLHPPPKLSPSAAAAPLSPDPPPREREFILAQCQASFTAESGGGPVVQVIDIPPSRILVVAEPVAGAGQGQLATWVMTRLTSPEHMLEDMRRYQTASGLALLGMAAALALMVNLGRNLRRERAQRERLAEELRRAEHLAALGRMLAGVAHEVRNPLAAIRSTVELYQRLPPSSRDPDALDTVLHGVDRLNALVGRLLFFARSGQERHRPVDVNAVVQGALALLRAQAESQGVALQTELADGLPPVSGSLAALEQVVLNLATNALQTMPHGGTLRCRTCRPDGPPAVELTVADTGPGVAAEELPHLFEPFHTTRPEGTGLGLALCREIVWQHGGRIELDREEGWGAVFRVTLPPSDRVYVARET